MNDPTTLPACPRIHPGIASQIKVTTVRNGTGKTYERYCCTVCRSTTALAQPREGRTFGQGALPDYGVVRLGWVPPERLLLDEVSHAT